MSQTFSTTSAGNPNAYLVVFTDDRASAWAMTALEAYDASHWGTYAMAYTADGSIPGLWSVSISDSFPSGSYIAVTYRMAGSVPATSDVATDDASFQLSNGNITSPTTNWDAPDSYLSIADGRSMAALLPGMAAIAALADEQLGPMLLLASLDIDMAMRYQGRKYDLTQTREFPRVAYGAPMNQIGGLIPAPGLLTPDTVIWDYDPTENVPVVPQNVLMATLYQVLWINQPKYSDILDKVRTGIAQEQIGTGSIAFAKVADIAAAGGLTGLDRRAYSLMARYVMQTGRIV
jgi:hypothetical protein